MCIVSFEVFLEYSVLCGVLLLRFHVQTNILHLLSNISYTNTLLFPCTMYPVTSISNTVHRKRHVKDTIQKISANNDNFLS